MCWKIRYAITTCLKIGCSVSSFNYPSAHASVVVFWSSQLTKTGWPWQLDVTKREADKQRQAREELEMEFQGMKNRMKMLQAVHSTGSRNVKGFQAAQAASLDLQR